MSVEIVFTFQSDSFHAGKFTLLAVSPGLGSRYTTMALTSPLFLWSLTEAALPCAHAGEHCVSMRKTKKKTGCVHLGTMMMMTTMTMTIFIF